MTRYKSVLVDYEGLQDSLDTHAQQGWKLVSANPDTWRKVDNILGVSEILGSRSSERPATEYCASYYLLIFVRDDDQEFDRAHAATAEEEEFSGFTLPEY
jgi:hypothetical protein